MWSSENLCIECNILFYIPEFINWTFKKIKC